VRSADNSFMDTVEETFVAVTLGLMTLITFANVVARYVFQDGILWGLEATVFLFAWLVLLGASYGVKKNFHIGIDILVNAMPSRVRRAMTLLAVAACLIFALLLLVGAWNYWSPFIGKRAFYETNDLPVPFFLSWLGDAFNDGEAYEKLPRFIPYAALPIGMTLLTYRLLQAAWDIWTGKRDLVIASHEAEEMMEEMGTEPQASSDDVIAGPR